MERDETIDSKLMSSLNLKIANKGGAYSTTVVFNLVTLSINGIV
jgi:hypothetical protein